MSAKVVVNNKENKLDGVVEKKKKRESNAGNDDLSTRYVILSTSLDIVNEIGFVDFRIDMISSRLGLSPGNITYHFSKKDILCHALWVEFMSKVKEIPSIITPLLDVKQCFIIFRIICVRVYMNRGIVVSRNSDITVTKSDDESEYSFKRFIDEVFDKTFDTLLSNGYLTSSLLFMNNIEKAREVVKDIFTTTARCWINMKQVTLQDSKDLNIDIVNDGALLMMYAFYPIMSEKARESYDEIVKLIEEGKIPVIV